MRSVMSRLLASNAARINKVAMERVGTEETGIGWVTLRLVPVVRGMKVFYRREWYLNQKNIAAKELAKIKLN